MQPGVRDSQVVQCSSIGSIKFDTALVIRQTALVGNGVRWELCRIAEYLLQALIPMIAHTRKYTLYRSNKK